MFTILRHMVGIEASACARKLRLRLRLSANLECRSEVRCTRLAANTGRKKSPSRQHRTTLSGYIFATKACIDNRKETC